VLSICFEVFSHEGNRERKAAEMTPDDYQVLRASNGGLSLVLQSRQKFSQHEVIIGDMLAVHQG
jgi:hypothetical protein